jgi:hypothetical protein
MQRSIASQRLQGSAAKGVSVTRKVVAAPSVSSRRNAVSVQASLAARPAGERLHESDAWIGEGPPLSQNQACSTRSLAPAGLKIPQYDGKLEDVDPEMANIIRNEKARQVSSGGASTRCMGAHGDQIPSHVLAAPVGAHAIG